MQILLLPVRLSHRTLKPIFNHCTMDQRLHLLYSTIKIKAQRAARGITNRVHQSLNTPAQQVNSFIHPMRSHPSSLSLSLSQVNILLINISQKWMADEFTLIN